MASNDLNIIKKNYKDIADSIRTKKGTSNEMSPSEMPAEIASIPTGITPTGTKEITTNGTHDVANYASASVSVPNPSTGTLDVTENGSYDVTSYAEVDVAVPEPQYNNGLYARGWDSDGYAFIRLDNGGNNPGLYYYQYSADSAPVNAYKMELEANYVYATDSHGIPNEYLLGAPASTDYIYYYYLDPSSGPIMQYEELSEGYYHFDPYNSERFESIEYPYDDPSLYWFENGQFSSISVNTGVCVYTGGDGLYNPEQVVDSGWYYLDLSQCNPFGYAQSVSDNSLCVSRSQELHDLGDLDGYSFALVLADTGSGAFGAEMFNCNVGQTKTITVTSSIGEATFEIKLLNQN